MSSQLKIAVIGAGTMGNGIAQTFATFGNAVTLVDTSESNLERGVAAIRKSLDRFVAKEKISQSESDAICDLVTTSTDLARSPSSGCTSVC